MWRYESEFVKQKTQGEQVRNPQEIIIENAFCGKAIPDSAPLRDPLPSERHSRIISCGFLRCSNRKVFCSTYSRFKKPDETGRIATKIYEFRQSVLNNVVKCENSWPLVDTFPTVPVLSEI